MNDKKITKQVVVNATTQQVWERWTTEKGIQSFFAQNCKVELREGGPFEMYFMKDNPEGLRGSEGCRFLNFHPYKDLSFSWNAPPQYPNVRNHAHKTKVKITFKELPENKTEVLLNHNDWLDGEEWEQVFEYFDKAWSVVLNNLQMSFED